MPLVNSAFIKKQDSKKTYLPTGYRSAADSIWDVVANAMTKKCIARQKSKHANEKLRKRFCA